MSEVIVRMEMPMNCAVCGLVDESDRCVLLGTFAGDKSVRIPKCPIIGELPEEHGELIDKRELLKKGMDMSWSVQKWVQEVDIVTAPTIVPATERSET